MRRASSSSKVMNYHTVIITLRGRKTNNNIVFDKDDKIYSSANQAKAASSQTTPNGRHIAGTPIRQSGPCWAPRPRRASAAPHRQGCEQHMHVFTSENAAALFYLQCQIIHQHHSTRTTPAHRVINNRLLVLGTKSLIIPAIISFVRHPPCAVQLCFSFCAIHA